MRPTLVVIAALMVGFTAGTAQPASAAPAPVVRVVEVLRGRVITTAGDPIASAIVSVVHTGHVEPIATARTDKDGRFELPLPTEPGDYAIRVLSLGYSPVTLALTGPSVASEVTMHSFTGP